MKPIATGVFGWCGSERRSNRYGSFHLSDSPYDGVKLATLDIDYDQLDRLTGKTVTVTVEVIASRESQHIGDLFLGIFPSRPKEGERVELGTGIFRTKVGYDDQPDFVLAPDDERTELWIDPRKLYRLHDQTVQVFIEETPGKTCSPAPDLKADDGAIDNGDGSYQVKTPGEADGPMRVKANIKRLGDGMFMVTPAGNGPKGTRHPIKRTKSKS